MQLFDQSATDHLRKLQTGEVSSVELTQAYLDRIAAVDDRVGAFLRVDAERALAQAAEIDTRRAKSQSVGKLGGLPVAIKDILSDRGQLNTCASKILAEFRPPYDSTVIAK